MERLTWKNERRKVADLIPADYNPRVLSEKARADLVASINEFSDVEPVVVNLDNRLIGGHQRTTIYADLGWDEIDVRVPSRMLTVEEEMRLNVRLNKNTGDWDFEKLAKFDLDMLGDLGFVTGDLDKIHGKKKAKDEDFDIETAMEKAGAPVAQLGEVYQLGDHRVMCGDATDEEHVMKLIEGKPSDMVFTDPPWNVAIGGDGNPRHRQREGLINDDLGKLFGAFLDRVGRSIAAFNKGDVYVVMGCEEWPNIHRALTEAGLHWSATIIWAKDQFVLGRSKYHRRYEPIWYGWNGSGKSTFVAGRDQDDVWEIPRPKRSPEHPTMKPVELCARAIKNSSERGDRVLDLFGGSGSTLIACEDVGRVGLLMELDPKYVDAIIARWEAYTGLKAVRI